MTNDKLDLQECLEHGRTAKVSTPVSVCVFVCVCAYYHMVSYFMISGEGWTQVWKVKPNVERI